MTNSSDRLDLKQVAKYLHQKQSTAYNLHRRRGLPSLRLGRKLYFRRSSIDTWLEAQERKRT